jgi:hypothetical protein
MLVMVVNNLVRAHAVRMHMRGLVLQFAAAIANSDDLTVCAWVAAMSVPSGAKLIRCYLFASKK